MNIITTEDLTAHVVSEESSPSSAGSYTKPLKKKFKASSDAKSPSREVTQVEANYKMLVPKKVTFLEGNVKLQEQEDEEQGSIEDNEQVVTDQNDEEAESNVDVLDIMTFYCNKCHVTRPI